MTHGEDTYMSWAYHQRDDIPFHFALAESYVICDMYQEGVIASTEPNRVDWMTGTM
jgi:phospholipase C